MNGYRLEKVTKEFDIKGSKLRVLDGLDLEIDDDKITVILGRSGCGKTTLLRVLAYLEREIRGEIKYYKDGRLVKPKTGMVFQESRLFPWLNVRENMTFFLDKRDREIEDRYLNLMKLEDFGEAYPSQLSGGMSHRVAIGRALAFEPDLLLMDEPFAALDYFTRAYMQEEIIRIHRETGKGIIFVTHNVDEALLLGHRILILGQGRILGDHDLDLKYPRDIGSRVLLNIKKDILKSL